MPVFLDTFGNASLAVFICDRCRMKRPMDEQMSDPSGFGAFQGSVQDEAGETLAEGMLKVYRPEDFWAYLAQSNPR